MSPRTKFIYENFSGGAGRPEDGSTSVGNLHTLVNKEHAPAVSTADTSLTAPKPAGISLPRTTAISNVSCFPGLSLPKMPSLPGIAPKDPRRHSVGIYQPGNEIENGEIILDEFSCALKLRILIHGRLFVTNKALYFYSYFNDSTLLGRETKIRINYSEITEIRKAALAGFFDNSIKLKLGDLKLFMTSFISRDTCYGLILEQMRGAKQRQSQRELEEEGTESQDEEEDVLSSATLSVVASSRGEALSSTSIRKTEKTATS